MKRKLHHPADKELFRLQHTIVITDPVIRIVYASSNMHQMNGYLPKRSIGQRPTIFQGGGTCAVQKANIRRAINSQQSFEAVLVNYRKNYEPYECLIKGSPVFTRTGRLVNFIAFEAIA